MILVIRISGQVDIGRGVEETLHRLRIRRKYSAVVLHNTSENIKILRSVRNFVSYGEISKETLKMLIEKRAQPIKKGKKIEVDKILDQIDKKSLHDLGLKPFFRLHPPRGGIDSKNHAGTSKKAVLGENKNISELVGRMY